MNFFDAAKEVRLVTIQHLKNADAFRDYVESGITNIQTADEARYWRNVESSLFSADLIELAPPGYGEVDYQLIFTERYYRWKERVDRLVDLLTPEIGDAWVLATDLCKSWYQIPEPLRSRDASRCVAAGMVDMVEVGTAGGDPETIPVPTIEYYLVDAVMPLVDAETLFAPKQEAAW